MNPSRPLRIPALAALVAVLLLGASCRDYSSQQEHDDGLKLRAVLRENECRITALNSQEFAYSEKVKLFLAAARTSSKTSAGLWPTVSRVEELMVPIDGFVRFRKKIVTDLNGLLLKTPLPIAIREDVTEILGERIAANRKWYVHLTELRDAIELDDEPLVHDQVRHTNEVFQAYGSLQNALKVAADDVEEQLRLPWWNDRSAPAGGNSQDDGCSGFSLLPSVPASLGPSGHK